MLNIFAITCDAQHVSIICDAQQCFDHFLCSVCRAPATFNICSSTCDAQLLFEHLRCSFVLSFAELMSSISCDAHLFEHLRCSTFVRTLPLIIICSIIRDAHHFFIICDAQHFCDRLRCSTLFPSLAMRNSFSVICDAQHCSIICDARFLSTCDAQLL